MSLATLLEPARVLNNVEARSKKHALEILSELIAGAYEDLSPADIFEALLDRERIGNTGLGDGIAIPHGKVADLDAATGAFLKLNEAVDFGARDGKPVRLIFAIAVPDDDEQDHFENVAETARVLANKDLVRMLDQVNGSRALFETLAGYTPPASEQTAAASGDVEE